MRQRFLVGASATAAVALALGLSFSGSVLAKQGDPIPGIEVGLEGDPGSVMATGKADLTAATSEGMATASITFDAGTLWGSADGVRPTGTVTATFPNGYTVTSAATGEASSPCLSGFAFTASTATAAETDCTGSVTLGGIAVTPVADTNVEPDEVKSAAEAAKDLKQCKADANKKHSDDLKSIASARQSVLKTARQAWLDAIKAANQAYKAARDKASADAKAAKAKTDSDWKASGPACTLVNTTHSNIRGH